MSYAIYPQAGVAMASIRKREIVRDGQRVTKYDATVTHKGARRIYQTFSTKAAAERWARKI